LVSVAPPAADTDSAGLLRSIVVDVRLPWFAPLVQLSWPSAKYRLSPGNDISPWTQIA